MAGELENLLAQWSGRRGLQPNALGEDGKHYYVFDGDYEIALSQVGPKIYLETELAPLPAQRPKAEELLERVLKLQLARARSAAEVVSLSPAGDGLVLFHVVSVRNLDLRRFDGVLGAFVNAAAFWGKKLGQGGERRAAAAPVAQFFFP